MLFLTFGNIFMFSVRFIIETFRYRCYYNIMQRLLRTASILVQHTRKAQYDSPPRTSLLNLAESSENVELEDDYIRISSVQPVQEVDLSSWTAYTSYLETHNAVTEPNQNIYILMEARRPRDLNKFVQNSLKIPPACRVHVLSLGCPVAWKTAEPFGIILHCSLSGLVSLSDAFGQDRLTLDEDLELIGFATVKTKGNPQRLVPQSVDVLSVKDSQTIQEAKRGEDGATCESLKLSGGTNNTHYDSSIQGKQSYLLHTASENGSSPDRYQQLEVQPIISSNNNVEVDHAEIFVVKKSAQINAKTFRKPAAQTSVISNDLKAEPAAQTSAISNHDIKNEPSSDKGKSAHEGPHVKPPNILIYCGIKDSARKFAEVKSSLEACINTEAYTIYHLKHDSILSTPWRSNAALLVVSSCTHLRQEAEDEIKNFVLKDGGTLLSFNSSVDSAFAEKLEEEGIDGERLVSFRFKDNQYITSVRGRFFYNGLKGNSEVIVPHGFCEQQMGDANSDLNQENQKQTVNDKTGNNRALVVKMRSEGGGVIVLSQLLLERDPTEYAKDPESFAALKQSNTDRLAVLSDILASLGIDTSSGTPPALTPCLLLAQRVGLKESFLESFKHRLKDNSLLKSQKMSLTFVQSPDQATATSSLLPVITNCDFDAHTEYFDPQAYWKHLKTLKLGQILFYTEVITSTMTVFDGLQFSVPHDMGLIAVAGRQISGRGRGGNAWLSPAGCAMFTLPLSLSMDSELGQRVSFLQHIVSLAVVQGVLTLPGYEDLDIKLKWPNDIYYGKEMKLGGVLVTSTVVDSTIYATIGCGFNVNNSNPTICINDIIRLRNISNPQSPELEPLSTSQLIARTMTFLEALLQNFEKDGHRAFCDQYYKRWLHGDSKVRLQLNKDTEGVIVGLDDYGFLSVRTPDGIISVQPDGNSFDMLHNLIHLKP